MKNKHEFFDKDEKALEDLRADFKFRLLEKIIKQFFTESLEAILLKKKRPRRWCQIVIYDSRHICKQTVHNWMHKGTISGTKVGKNRYFTEDEIRAIFYY